MTRPASATGIQVTTRLEDVKTTGCGSSEPSRTQVRLSGNFFRDGPPPANPRDNTNIVFAVSQIVSVPGLPADTLLANFFADRCLDFDCNDSVNLGFASFVNVAPKEDVTLGIELDAANNRFIFTKDSETHVLSNIAADRVNTILQDLDSKGIMVRHRLETCLTRAVGFVAASFSNFRIKP